jgi:ubiquinone/menaquinone biosynthesis C-methylase UbiE
MVQGVEPRPVADFDDKAEIQKQWNTDPCGSSTAPEHEPGTAAFFFKVERERYEVYAPWMRTAMGFEAYGGKKVLEIGPGLGTDHAQFARAGAEMYALDLTARHLELTRRHFQLEDLVTRLVRGDAEALPFADGAFDVVYSFGVLHHTPGMQAAIHEVDRVLRPGGLAIVGFYHKHSAFHWICTMLVRGVMEGGLWRKGYRRLLADIEHRSADSEAVPLVKVLTRRDCRRLFAGFGETRIRADQIDYAHFWPSLPPATGLSRRLLETLAHRWGWYLTVFSRK